MRHFIVCAVFVVCGMTDSLRAQDWPSWRGPYGTGVANGSNYPVKWSEKTIAWKYQLAGIGASTPAVSGDNIIVTLTKGGQNTVLCVGIDGQQKWTQTFGKALEGKSGQAGTGANPSPVIHDGHVFVYFKSGDFGCFDLSGHLKWQVNVFERFANVTSKTLWWDLGASPVLTSDAVVITMLHSGPSYLAALDRETGEVKWKYDRETNAPREAAQSYTTPIVTKNPAGQEVIIVTGADYVTCHSATDGKELWRFGTLNPTGNEYFRSISSSVSQEGIVVAPYSRGQTLTAIKMGGSGDVTKSHLLWSNNDTAADVVTPVVHGNRIFVVRDVKQDRGIVDCLELASGK